MDIFKDIISKVVVFFLIYFIISRAFSNKSRKRKSIIIFIISIGFSLAFGATYLIDRKIGYLAEGYTYLIYIIINLVVGISYLMYGFINNKHDKFIKYRKEEKPEPVSVVHYKEVLYLIMAYNSEYYLLENDNYFSGIKIKANPNFFHDEIIDKYIKSITTAEYAISKRGKIIDRAEKIKVAIYKIDFYDYPNLKFVGVNYQDIINLMMTEENKEIIFKVLVNETIDIER